MDHSPPRWADRFLRWYCNPELLEEIQGDAYELYRRRNDTDGRASANRKFVWDVVRFFRWSNIKRSNSKYYSSNNLSMLRNYIKVGYRNLTKNWVTTTINILGLALAIGCTITLFLFLDFQYNMDKFHSRKKNIYQVVSHVFTDNDLELWSSSPMPMGPQLKGDHPAINETVRIQYSRGNVRYKDRVFNESITFIDPSMMDVFDFPVAFGDKYSLTHKDQVIISARMAEKYFGDLSPVGERISIKYTDGTIRPYLVGAVMEEYPLSASFTFNMIIPISNLFDLKDRKSSDWSRFTDATFVLMEEGHSPLEVEDHMAAYMKNYNQSDADWSIDQFEFIPLEDLALRNYQIHGTISNGGHPAGRIALACISALLLALACFNYMNISVASATKRLKEIALRKVMGGARRNIINQFLIENLLLTFIALIIGTALSYYLFLPGFNIMLPITVPFSFSSFLTMILFFGGLLILIGLASGAYPAFYISRFQPVHIFKGKEKFGSKNIFSRILLGFQFTFAFTTIVGGMVFTDNATYLKYKDWGYNQEGIISIPVGNTSEFQGMRDAAFSNSNIISVAGSRGHVGRSHQVTSIEHIDKQVKSLVFEVGPNYLETMNMRLIEGRLFDKSKAKDHISAAVINEKFAEKMGWTDPLHKNFVYDSIKLQVIGVVEDFHYRSFYVDISPVFFKVSDVENFNFLTVQTKPGTMLKVNDYLRESWQKLSPNDPYDQMFQEDALAGFYQENRANIVIISFISGISVLLACLGLFGLLSFNIHTRMKEFSVRKVLGAGSLSIIKLANKEYSWILLIAFLLGAPTGFLAIDQLIQSIYPDPKETDAGPFLISISIMLFTVALTVTGQIIKAIKVNPAQVLRNE